MAFQKTDRPTTWQDATAITIGRIQQIFALVPLTMEHKINLYERAQAAVRDQGKGIHGATEYWNTFVNSLRTIVVGLSATVDPKDSFD
jgi:hypothetical protein